MRYVNDGQLYQAGSTTPDIRLSCTPSMIFHSSQCIPKSTPEIADHKNTAAKANKTMIARMPSAHCFCFVEPTCDSLCGSFSSGTIALTQNPGDQQTGIARLRVTG